MAEPIVHGTRTVPFNTLAAGVQRIRGEIDAALDRVLQSGWFLAGPETTRFEAAFAAYHQEGGAERQCVGVGTGTDALWIGLKALGVEPGDEVLVVANAGVPPVAAVVATGARPVFCDVDAETHTLDPAEIGRAVTPRTRALLVVHLYGRVAAMDRIMAEARKHGLKVLEDCAQAHGARYQGRLAGTFGEAAAFSFFPTKNLGALGDGGAILTTDAAVAARARRLRQYGWERKYISEEHSTVTRLDEVQAAVLSVKLRYLDDWNQERAEHARRYRSLLADVSQVAAPGEVDEGDRHVYHLFVVRVGGGQRDALRAAMSEQGVGVDVHYPLPAHLQKPYVQFGAGEGSLPHTEQSAREVLSLPMYPELPQADLAYVVERVRAFAERTGKG